MPRKCCVPYCRSNYRATNEYVSVFQFPKNEMRRQLWIQQINRDFTPSKHSVVCIKHFEDRFIIKDESRVTENGVVLHVRRKVPTLTKDGYPTIFNDVPVGRNRRLRFIRRFQGMQPRSSESPEVVYLGSSREQTSTYEHKESYASCFEDSDPLEKLDPTPVQGKRIVDFMFLFQQLQQISAHNSDRKCRFSHLKILSEATDGLTSNIKLQCNNCEADFTISTNDKSDGSDLNYSAVSGAEVSGLGFLGLKTLCDSIGMLSLTEKKYYSVQKDIELYEDSFESSSGDNNFDLHVKEEVVSDEESNIDIVENLLVPLPRKAGRPRRKHLETHCIGGLEITKLSNGDEDHRQQNDIRKRIVLNIKKES